MERLKFSEQELTDMPTVEHFKIPADDVKRAQRFYKDVFEWTMQKWSHPDNADQDFGTSKQKMKMAIEVLKEV